MDGVLYRGANVMPYAREALERLRRAGWQIFFATNNSTATRDDYVRQLEVRNGVLAPSFVVNYSHDDETIDATVDIVAEALDVYRRALEDGVERYLVGPSVKMVVEIRDLAMPAHQRGWAEIRRPSAYTGTMVPT